MVTRTLVILTLNEIDGVTGLVPELPGDIADELLAVDGGSTDGTCQFLRSKGIPVVGQAKRGRGEAFRTAVDVARGDYFVFFSPDGNEDWRDIPRLFGALAAGADLAIASRFLPGGRNEEDDSRLPLRKWANRALTFCANLIWNRGHPPVTDSINGFRAISRRAFVMIRPQSSGFTIEYEMTIRAMKHGLSIAEIPTIEGDRIGGQTKGPSLRLVVPFLRCLLRELLDHARAEA